MHYMYCEEIEGQAEDEGLDGAEVEEGALAEEQALDQNENRLGKL
jgi:hypothetical protein